jgi:hypothetical protein
MPGCNSRHRTVFEFSEAHPEWMPSEVDISHTWHIRASVTPTRLVMEPSPFNLSRNKCRNRCVCNVVPACFSDPPAEPMEEDEEKETEEEKERGKDRERD